MNRRHEQPYEREFDECLEMLHRMGQEEHDALLREAGILDERGELAPRYRPPTEPDSKSAATS